MKKADLQTGMWVEYRNGDKRCVMLGTTVGDVLVCEISYSGLGSFTDDLKCIFDIARDIVKIFKNDSPCDMLTGKCLTLIWQREPEIKEVTMAEVEEKFGCPVKIIKEAG